LAMKLSELIAFSSMLPSELYTSVLQSSVARLKMRASYCESASSPPMPSVSSTTHQTGAPSAPAQIFGRPQIHKPRVQRWTVGPT